MAKRKTINSGTTYKVKWQSIYTSAIFYFMKFLYPAKSCCARVFALLRVLGIQPIPAIGGRSGLSK